MLQQQQQSSLLRSHPRRLPSDGADTTRDVSTVCQPMATMAAACVSSATDLKAAGDAPKLTRGMGRARAASGSVMDQAFLQQTHGPRARRVWVCSRPSSLAEAPADGATLTQSWRGDRRLLQRSAALTEKLSLLNEGSAKRRIAARNASQLLQQGRTFWRKQK